MNNEARRQIRSKTSKIKLGICIIVFCIVFIISAIVTVHDMIKYQILNRGETYYYSSLSVAITDINLDRIGDKDDIKSEDKAIVKVENLENGPVITLLQDHTTTRAIDISKNLVLDLNGKTLYSTAPRIFCLEKGGLRIDGRVQGSEISIVDNASKEPILILTYPHTNIQINGGTYSCKSNGMKNTVFDIGGDAMIQNVYINTQETTANCVGVVVKQNAAATILNSTIDARSQTGRSYCIWSAGTVNAKDITATSTATSANAISFYNMGSAKLSQSTLIANAPIISNQQNDINVYSAGVYNGDANSTINADDCNTYGTLAGICNWGTVKINGGQHDGYIYGGILFNSINDSYIKNATLRQTAMQEGLTADKKSENSALCIFGDLNLYIDKCEMYSDVYAIRIGETEKRACSIYISNSTIDSDALIQLLSDSNKIYIGVGNNFNESQVDCPNSVITTDQSYED